MRARARKEMSKGIQRAVPFSSSALAVSYTYLLVLVVLCVDTRDIYTATIQARANQQRNNQGGDNYSPGPAIGERAKSIALSLSQSSEMGWKAAATAASSKQQAIAVAVTASSTRGRTLASFF